MKNYDYDIVILMKRIVNENNVSYVPFEVLEGNYNIENQCFIDNNGNKYYHIINNVDIGYFGRKNMNELKNIYKYLTPSIIKKTLLHNYKKYFYLYCSEEVTTFAPVIGFGSKKTSPNPYLDDDIKRYYLKNYPDYYNKLVEIGDIEKDFVLSEIALNNFGFEGCYNLVKSKLNVDDSSYIELLNAVYNHLTTDDNNNTLINTDNTLEKMNIIKSIAKIFDLPVININFNSIYSVEVLNNKLCIILEKLVEDAKNDVKKAQLGIIIFNDIDRILKDNYMSSTIQLQDMLVNVIDEGGVLSINDGKYEFKFDNVLLFGIGNWNRINKIGYINNTIDCFNKHEVVEYGMIKEFADKFSNFIEIKEKEDVMKKNLQKKD